MLRICLQFQFYLRPCGGAGLQSSGRGADTYDEPAGFVGRPPVQRNAGRSDADVEERGILCPLQRLLAKLAATRALEHHRILIHSNTAAFRSADAAFPHLADVQRHGTISNSIILEDTFSGGINVS